LSNLTALPQVGGSIQLSGDSSAYVISGISGSYTGSSSVIIVTLAQQKAAVSTAGTSAVIRYNFSLLRITGHDFLNVGTGGITTTNYPGTPSQAPDPSKQVTQNYPGRVYYISTDQSGNFNVGSYFAVNQATGSATLNASAFNLSGLSSLRLGSIGAQLGAQINEFSTDGQMSQNSPVKVPTQSAVVTYVGAQLQTGVSSIVGPTSLAFQTGQSLANVAYSVFSNAVYGTTIWSLTGNATANISIGATTGVVYQTSSIPAGTYTATIFANSFTSNTSLSKTVTFLSTANYPLFSSTTLPTVVNPGVAFSSNATSVSANNNSVTYSITSGALPNWLTFNGNGVITGTSPTPATNAYSSTYAWTVQATVPAYGYTISQQFSWRYWLGTPQGQTTYTTAGTYQWTCPSGVTSISVVCLGGGGGGSYTWSYGGGGGGGLGYINNYTVVPGQVYTVVVGAAGSYVSGTNNQVSAAGGTSYFNNTSTVAGFGAGQTGGTGGQVGTYGYTGGGGYTGTGGGRGGSSDTSWTSPGSGAGGYSGQGGDGNGNTSHYGYGGGAGSGDYYSSTYGTGAGGGVGYAGQGLGNNGSGTAQQYTPFTGYYAFNGSYGGGGSGASGGANGYYGQNPFSGMNQSGGNVGILGGNYGGGGGGSGTSYGGGNGAVGFVRIIWPGNTRVYPSTSTADASVVAPS
jgi:hypothetical protein